jgi:hypothetical protein
MVWIIPYDRDENKMTAALIKLMVNMESNKTLFGPDGSFIMSKEPFNVYENEYFIDEYRFNKGYIQYTGKHLDARIIENNMNNYNNLMRQDISVNINDSYQTTEYTLARTHTEQYERLITYENPRPRQLKNNKIMFVWKLRDFMCNMLLRKTYYGRYYDKSELTQLLSTIIYDNDNIFKYDKNKKPLTPSVPYYHINFPELYQTHLGDRLIDVPISIDKKFNIRGSIRAHFLDLIPNIKNSNIKKNLLAMHKVDNFHYVEYEKNHLFVENKEIPFSDLNLAQVDHKYDIITKLSKPNLAYETKNITSTGDNIPLEDILYMLCHICCTPLYDRFYYVKVDKRADIAICAMCFHNANIYSRMMVITVLEKFAPFFIAKSPLTVYDVFRFIPKPPSVSNEAYEKYKKMMQYIFDNTLELKKTGNIICKYENSVFINGISIETIKSLSGNESDIFIMKIT